MNIIDTFKCVLGSIPGEQTVITINVSDLEELIQVYEKLRIEHENKSNELAYIEGRINKILEKLEKVKCT